MSKVICIAGESGSGKTTSMRNLDPKATYYIDCDKKGLSWKGWKNQYNLPNKNYKATDDNKVISSIITNISEKAPHIKHIIIDTINGIMVGDEMRRVRAEMKQTSTYSAIYIKFDIKSGEYKNYYSEQFRNSTFENKTFKGLLTLFVPDKNSQYYESQRKKFWSNITAIEDYNNGFKFSGNITDIAKLQGKTAKLLVCEQDYRYEGKLGTTIKPYGFIYRDDDWEEKIKYMHSILKNKNVSSVAEVSVDTQNFQEVLIDDGDLPF